MSQSPDRHLLHQPIFKFSNRQIIKLNTHAFFRQAARRQHQYPCPAAARPGHNAARFNTPVKRGEAFGGGLLKIAAVVSRIVFSNIHLGGTCLQKLAKFTASFVVSLKSLNTMYSYVTGLPVLA